MSTRFEETFARISARVDAFKALQEAQKKALGELTAIKAASAVRLEQKREDFLLHLLM